MRVSHAFPVNVLELENYASICLIRVIGTIS